MLQVELLKTGLLLPHANPHLIIDVCQTGRLLGMRARTWFTIFICCVAIILTAGRAAAEEHEFRYKAPEAKSVELICEFNGWKSVPMTKGDNGMWRTKVSLSPGTYGYKFLVNGTDWVFDPDNSNKKTVDGIENSAVEIK